MCKKENPILVDVAIDAAVASGIVNKLEEIGIPAVGPTKEAGQIEWDKAWSRQFMWKHKIPHPTFKVFHSEREGISFVKKQRDQSWFVKAYGLVDGKGALPAKNNKEAIERIKEMKRFGEAGKTFLLEQWLEGEEFSSFALCDGKTFKIIGNAQDHKRMYTFDEGENTGGLGSSTPCLVVTPSILNQVKDIFKNTLSGLEKEGRPFKGILYMGGIIVDKKVYIIEFNARWGDPEAEVLIPSIKTDMYKIGIAMSQGKLRSLTIKTDTKARVAVTGSLRPGVESKERQIFGLEKVKKLKGITVYGTRIKERNKKYYAASGRLFHIVAEGKNVIEARRRAYEAMSMLYIEGNNLHYRTDIGWRDVERLTASMVR